MEHDLAASRQPIEIWDLLLQVSATLQKAGCGKSIDAEKWLMNWLDTPNPAFDGVCSRVGLQEYKRQSKGAKRA